MLQERRRILRMARSGSSRLYSVRSRESDASDGDVIWKNYSVRTDLALEAQTLVSQRTGQEAVSYTHLGCSPGASRIHLGNSQAGELRNEGRSR